MGICDQVTSWAASHVQIICLRRAVFLLGFSSQLRGGAGEACTRVLHNMPRTGSGKLVAGLLMAYTKAIGTLVAFRNGVGTGVFGRLHRWCESKWSLAGSSQSE